MDSMTRLAPTQSYSMTDLESGKRSYNVTLNSMDNEKAQARPVLGRRRITNDRTDTAANIQQLVYGGDEDTLTEIGNFFHRIHNASILTRYALYILPVAALLAIPLVLFDTIWWGTRIHSAGQAGIRLFGLFVWLETIWLGLWICKLIAHALPFVFEAVCGMVSGGIRKYSVVLTSLEIPVSLFLWTILAFATTKLICVFDQSQCNNTPWLSTLTSVFRAGIAAAAIFLAEKLLIQLIAIDYHRKQFDEKISESKRLLKLLDMLYDRSRTLFPEFCKEFKDEDADIQGNILADMRSTLAKARVKTKIFRDMGRMRDQVTAAFGAMASDIAGKEVFSATSAHAIVVEALETERASKALARRLWFSFAKEGNDALYKSDLAEILGSEATAETDEIFALLDRDMNGDVSLDEMEMLIVNAGLERKNRANSMHDISQAIAVLDRLLSVVVLAGIALVYATTFSKTFANKTTQLWTTFTGLAFAIGGTVTEFLSCCLFLFVKHPYDVGDRIDIPSNTAELVVDRISLMYTVFRRIDNNKTVQIPHNILSTLWIENVSRSKPMKERLTLSVAATTSNEDILALRAELVKFVTAEENRRDYQNDLGIELLSVGDMKQLDLRVEIRHKSNFANEALRAHRRNKFMCELLAAMRRIPIAPPGGSGPPLGDPKNPSYSVALSDSEAIAARTKYSDDTAAARMFPTGEGSTDTLSSAFEAFSSVNAMGKTLVRQMTNTSTTNVSRRSGDSIRPSVPSRSGSVPGPAVYAMRR